ncbi:translation initiation factor IF-2 [Syngnathus typhle]|uniref:translation initiation factor IF-2 n=1 Tax=Syngnathus typhle TaxID=161592 RepID=UPI002A6B02AB|nr:translation initiation factor IF-2 [Syngnathus typhle]
MWWLVLVALSYLDRELALGSGVAPPSRGRLSEECGGGGPRGSRPFTPRMDDEPKRRGSEVTRRAKRGFTYPGTLWCGAGNMADRYDQLGEFEETDSCCRTHDHCPHVIHAFSSKYGYTNFKWHSICHCDCDQALKACLHRVNDTSSRVMGQAFFNVIAAPCFQLLYEERCAERHWYGPCKRYEKLPVAVVEEAVPYEYGAADIGSPERKTDHEKEESATPAAPPGPEAPSLHAVENFTQALATIVSSTSAAQTSHNKRKKKKDRGQKTKKAMGGQRSKHKKGATATLPLTKSVNDVITGEAAPETARLRPTGRPSAQPPKKRGARTGRGGLRVALASPEQAPRPAGYNLSAGLTSHPKGRPSEEIPQPPVHLKSPAGSPSKKRLTRKEEAVVTWPKEPVQPTVAWQNPPGAPERWQDRRDNEDGAKRSKGRPDSGAQSTGAQPAQSLDGPSGQRNQSTKAASQSATSLTSAEPSRSFAPTTRLGRKAAPGGPALPAEESVAKRRAGGASGDLRSSAVLRSVERARRQFARKKKRKAARTVRPPSLARR